jgi:hypothetical protein
MLTPPYTAGAGTRSRAAAQYSRRGPNLYVGDAAGDGDGLAVGVADDGRTLGAAEAAADGTGSGPGDSAPDALGDGDGPAGTINGVSGTSGGKPAANRDRLIWPCLVFG